MNSEKKAVQSRKLIQWDVSKCVLNVHLRRTQIIFEAYQVTGYFF